MHRDKWMKAMVAKHGSEEAVRAFLRESAAKSSRNKGGTGGFHKLKEQDPARFKEISARGGRSKHVRDIVDSGSN